ncbi:MULTISPECIES: GumC family protein [Olivibacter]|jgi:capsular exopolysaccharide synthesis family protein|uniref:non-specific protein-tyrosine kinase n=1 Tax=Olivibacter oleidegradans TaxID=760123 RepID=A0ABV6HGU1_9SPHI|nr:MULTISPECIES: polysaccharide biosynthesis tyrosine autokinase [Olivibacter]MDM8176750.1 polysaccharide biosynthesis tyrosine autokinase [Olivibacter sp. 47]QEL00568.1 polysaccharide biosynthesis tyrosine autokinase [Olivibacter sp. LS-1]
MKMQVDRDNDKKMSRFFKRMASFWYVYLLGVCFFVLLAFAYLKYSTPQYLVSGVLMLKDQKSMTESKAVTSFANDNGLSFLLKPTENVMNEMKVLSSRSLALEVVKELNLNIKTGIKNGPTFKELFDKTPFNVSVSKIIVDSVKERNFEVEVLEGEKLRIISEDENFNKVIAVNNILNTKQYNIGISKKESAELRIGEKYWINIISENAAANSLLNSFSVELTDKTATTANLQLFYPDPKRGELILQTIMSRYISDNKDKKIRLADSMLVFIDDRLNLVASELTDVEKELEGFRSSNRITDLSEQSKMLVGNANEYYNRLKDQQAQLKVIRQLEAYVQNPSNSHIPSSTVIQNAAFNSSLNQYNVLLQEYEKKKLSYTDSNPVIINLTQQIKSERNNLLQNIASYKKELQVTNEELGRVNSGFNSQISQVPAKERQFVNYSRQQELKQQLYVYLLQKREEANIAKSSNAELANIVDDAKSSEGPVKPMPSVIYLMATMMGLIVPFGFLNLRELTRTKIQSEFDFERYSDVEIIGKIGHSASEQQHVVGSGARNSALSEGFRSLRANLYYALQSKQSKTIMVTSTIKGEGKSFMSLNLGLSLSLTGKRVVFVELDLRQPKLAAMMGINEPVAGFSEVISGRLEVEDCIVQSPLSPSCFLLSAGISIENPAELILDEKVEALFDKLKHRFDYVVVDSPPVGLVSDAFIIQQYVEMTAYVCRHNYTKKDQFDFINELNKKNRLKNMYLIVNDINVNSSAYYSYGYGYGYEDTLERKNWRKRLKL